MLLASALQYADRGVWWLDGAAAVAISAGLAGVGLRTVVHNVAADNRFWDPKFWTVDAETYRLSIVGGQQPPSVTEDRWGQEKEKKKADAVGAGMSTVHSVL